MSNFYRLTLILLLSVLWITGAIYDYNYWDSSKTKAYAWNYTLEKDNVKYYQEYLNNHQNSKHSAEAMKLLKIAMIRKEATDWKNTNDINTAEDFHKFLKKYPKTEHKDEISKALDKINKEKKYASISNLWLNIIKQLQKRENLYSNLTGTGVVTLSSKESERKQKEKTKPKKIVPVVEIIINKSVNSLTIIYKNNGKFLQVNSKGSNKKIDKNLLKIVSIILKNKYWEGEKNAKRGVVLIFPRRYSSNEKEVFEKTIINLLSNFSKAINQDKYNTRLLTFWRLLEEDTSDSMLILSKNAYTSKEIYKLYTRKKYFTTDLVDNKKRWSYASGYIFGRVIRDTPILLNENHIAKGIKDGMKMAPPNLPFTELNNILTEFTTSSDNWKLLKKKKDYDKILSYAMGYLFGTKIRMSKYPVSVSSSAKGIARGSALEKPKFGIKIRQQKHWSLNKFFEENGVFSAGVE
ncbi:hypothetical protein MNBD_GAMMA09-3315 [hydrothermal vent metagenome]|uniref:Uncharacterized protein n=1 Tax=hydrothermal vent metagenome TaxID=652676 RepID=A0A3B0XRK9_9ZZZZ